MNAERKHALAKRLTKAIGNQFVVTYAPSYMTTEESYLEPNPSLGHLWYAEFYLDHRTDDDPNQILLDDRKGDIPQQLAEALRRKAAVYAAMAAEVEREVQRTTARKAVSL